VGKRAVGNAADDRRWVVPVPQVLLVREPNALVRVVLGDAPRPDWVAVLVADLRAEEELRPSLTDATHADHDPSSVLVQRVAPVAIEEDERALRLDLLPEVLQEIALAVWLEDPAPLLLCIVRAPNRKALGVADAAKVLFAHPAVRRRTEGV